MAKLRETKRQNKFTYLYVIQFKSTTHPTQWEDTEVTEDYKEARYLLKESRSAYRNTGTVRMIERRQLN